MSNHPDLPTDAPTKNFTDSLLAIFINKEKELRSGWRVALFFLAFVLAIILINGITQGLATLIPPLHFLASGPLPDASIAGTAEILPALMSQVYLIIAALIASAVCARLLERRTLTSVGFKFHRGWLKDFALGSLVGALSLSLAVGLATVARADHFTIQIVDVGRLALNFGYIFAFFLLAGALEELMFRGFALQALIHNIGAFAAITFTSIFFGLAHFANPQASIFSTINTVLAGIWLGLAYMKTRNLWLATGLHYSWNLVMAFVFGLPVSGITSFQNLEWLKGASQSPVWVSGGDYGPEAGAAATLALIISMLVIWKSRWLRPSAEMLAAISHGKPVRPLSIITKDEGKAPDDQ